MSIQPEEVNRFHTKDDVDSSWRAHHHTLGTGPNQAATGNHAHETGFEGLTLTGSKGGNVALANLITMLASVLGFTDSTT